MDLAAHQSSPSAAYLTTGGSAFDTLLGVYTGMSVSTLTTVVQDDDGGEGASSLVSFVPLSDTTYSIAIDGKNLSGNIDFGTVKLTLSLVPIAPPPDLVFVVDGTVPTRSPGQFSGKILGPASTTVHVEYSIDLIHWTNLFSASLDSQGQATFTDSQATEAYRVYRARAGSSSPPTQVSLNCIGYADRQVTPGQQIMLANPFVAIDNTVVGLFPNPPFGTTVYKWNGQTYDSSTWLGSSWSDPSMTLHPGEGVIYELGGSSTITQSFVGAILEGYSEIEIDPGFGVYSATVPLTGKLRSRLDLPMLSGDSVHRMIGGTYTNHTYLGGGVWNPTEPVIDMSESFWINRSFPAVGFWWRRNFLIWE